MRLFHRRWWFDALQAGYHLLKYLFCAGEEVPEGVLRFFICLRRIARLHKLCVQRFSFAITCFKDSVQSLEVFLKGKSIGAAATGSDDDKTQRQSGYEQTSQPPLHPESLHLRHDTGIIHSVDTRPAQALIFPRSLTPRVKEPLLIPLIGYGHCAVHLNISVKPSPSVRPRRFILYNGLKLFQHRKWRSRSGVLYWMER